MKFSQSLRFAPILTVAAVTIFSLPAYAVTSSGQAADNIGQALEIAPPVLNISGDPGETLTAKIALRDVSTTSLRVTSEINDFTASGEDGTPKILLDQKEKSPYSLIDWIEPLPALNLEPKQIQDLELTIKIPKNASPGGYYGVIRFTATPPDLKDSGVSLSASLGTLVMLRVKGTANERLAISEFYAAGTDGKKSSVFEGVPFTFIERLKNEGNVYEQPTGTILITDTFGKVAANVNVNLEQRNVLPQTTRKFTQNFDKAALGDRVLFGLYNAKLTLNYGNKQTITKTVSFWVIPFKLIFGIILALIALVIAGRLFLKRYADKAVSKSRGKSRRR